MHLRLIVCAVIACTAHAAVSVLLSNTRPQATNAAQRLCVLDALEIDVECTGASSAQLLVWRQPLAASSNAVAVLYSNESIACAGGDAPRQAIECLLNKEHCSPRVASVRVDGEGNLLVVQFAMPTTMPQLLTRAQIFSVLSIAPQPQRAMVGDWSAEDKLEIALDASDAQELLHAQEGGELQVEVRESTDKSRLAQQDTNAAQRSRRLRFKEHGNYVIELFASDNSMDHFNVIVEHCEEAVVARPTASGLQDHDAGHRSIALHSAAEPDVSVAGVLAVPAAQGLTFHPPSLFRSDAGWTLAFWLHLQEAHVAPSTFRTLFYKGSGDQRTPSAWLLPNSRHVALRASTVQNPDVGATSSVELPTREWIHLAFVFDNSSDQFEYNFFVNGRIDVSLQYHHTVLPNDAALSILKDPTYLGPPALVTGLRIWEAPLPSADVETEYTESSALLASAWSNHASLLFDEVTKQYSASRSAADADTADEEMNDLPVSTTAPCDELLRRLEHYQNRMLHNSSTAALSFGVLSLFGAEHAEIDCEHDKQTVFAGDVDDGIRALLQAAGQGESDAWFYLAVTYLAGVESSVLPRPDVAQTTLPQAVLPKELKFLQKLGVEPCSVNGISALHIAVVLGSKPALAALAWRYSKGICVPKCLETAAWYARWAGEVAADRYSRKGRQPLLQRDRITYQTGQNLYESQKGLDDHALQAQIALAEQGDIPALMATGNLFYYGARGLPRDQPRAFEYFHRAATMRHVPGMTAAANMLIKGEGTTQNVSQALQLYENAAEEGSVQALNGLGFLYFNGDAVPQNMTRAFHYFSLAAEAGADGDAFFNAAYCLFYGHGVEVDHSRAITLFDKAARRFGHFSSIWELGRIYMDGKVVARSASTAVEYLIPATHIGPWANWLRRAFDFYLHGNSRLALMDSLLAAQFGYEEGFSNAAFIAKHKLSDIRRKQLFGESSLHAHIQQGAWAAVFGSQDAYRFVGDELLANNPDSAIWWLSKASHQGSSRASLTLAFLYAASPHKQHYTHYCYRYLNLAITQEQNQHVKYALQTMRQSGFTVIQLGACMTLPSSCQTDVVEATLLVTFVLLFILLATVVFTRRRARRG